MEVTEVSVKEGLTSKIQIMIEPSLLRRLDDWRFANRIGSRSSAMRQLIKRGLGLDQTKGPAEAATSPSHGSNDPR